MAVFWYPKAFAARIPFHENFDENAQATGSTYGLSVGDKADIALDKDNVPKVVNFKEGVAAYAQAVTEWAEIILEGEIGSVFPPPPTAPVPPTFALGSKTAIRGRTLLYAGVIKSDADYTPLVGENYMIVSPADPPPGTPSIKATALTQSQVRLQVTKAGYNSVAIDARYTGGVFAEIGVCTTSEFIDGRPPQVPGQPDLIEYRCQGRENNARTGPLSGIVSVVTVP